MAMLSEKGKIQLVHECRPAVLNRMLDDLKPGSSAEQFSYLNARYGPTRP